MLRIPQEPDPVAYPHHTGVVAPSIHDFLKSDKVDSSAIIAFGKEVTDMSHPSKFTKYLETRTFEVNGTEVEINVDVMDVAGSAHPDLKAVRHRAKVTGLSPDVVMDALVRLNYTSALDKYTYHIEPVQDVHLTKQDVDWCHVVYTADSLFPGFAVREFVTLDGVSTKERLLFCRSCVHPAHEVTPPPGLMFCNKGRRYRSPVIFFSRVIATDGGCEIIQFQYSDVGGLIPIDRQIRAVVDFGVESIPKVVAIVQAALRNGTSLGKGSSEYGQNPLKHGWHRKPGDMIPGAK